MQIGEEGEPVEVPVPLMPGAPKTEPAPVREPEPVPA